MNNQKIKKLKKYLFLISMIFCVASFIHIGYSYLKSNSKVIPVKGGYISEGIIGKLPSLNPLKVPSGNNKYILKLLYRSLLKYDLEQEKIVGDIATCDISSPIDIECIINDGAIWSNGKNITVDDVKSTYETIRETKSNPTIASLLDGVVIETRGNNEIVFKNDKEDINFLNIFFQPIVSREILDTLTMEQVKGNFPYKNGIYSGNYILSEIKPDANLGISKMILLRNENFNNANIYKIDIYVFPNEVSLQNNIKVINVFNDENNTLGDSVPRLQSYRYNLPQFLSLFINTSKIENIDLRTFILNEVNRKNLINTLGNINYRSVYNPYLTETKINTEPVNKNLESIMASIGYKKKSILIQELKQKSTSSTGEVEKSLDNSDNKNSKIDRSKGIDRYQENSKIITSPNYIDKYNFITKDNFKIIGKAGLNVEEIYINDYKLQGFNSGDSKFFYRIKEDYENIKEGENNYKIFFVKNGKKELQEEINFLYYKNKGTLEKQTKIFIDNLYKNEEEKLKQKYLENSKNLEKKEVKIPQKELKKLENLDDKLFYNNKLNPYTLDLIYLNARRDFKETAEFIKTSLKQIGIIVNINGFGEKDFGNQIKEKKYDLILGGIDLGYFDFNLFYYFYSGQASNWNYSGIKKPSLDILLEETKKNIYNNEETKKLQNKILTILKDEQIVKTLYSPKINLLIDKNIKLNKNFNYIPKTSMRIEVIKNLFKKQEQNISLKGKSFFGFVGYLLKRIYE